MPAGAIRNLPPDEPPNGDFPKVTPCPGRKYPQRILWVSDYFPRPHMLTSGIWSIKTAVAIRKRGVEVVVLAPSPWIPRWLAFTPTLAAWTDVPRDCEMDGLPVYYPKCPHYPNRAIRHHIYNNIPYLESAAIYKWIEETISHIMRRFPFQLVHANFMFPGGYIGYRIKKKYGVPLVFHERGARRLKTALTQAGLRRIYSEVVHNSDLVMTPSEKMADTIRNNFPCPGKVMVVRDAGDTEVAEGAVEPRPDRYRRNKIILSVGALIERKGHEVLVKATGRIREEIPGVKCLIIGSGIRLARIRQLIRNLRLEESVELLGELPHREVLKFMSWCDVFVLPSWDEAFGTVNAEAMVFGKPIVGCAGEGISEVIEDGVHGFLVEKRDVESLARAVSKILTDGPTAGRMVAKVRQLSESALNYTTVSEQIVQLYATVLS